MKTVQADTMRNRFVLMVVLNAVLASSLGDRDLSFCGTWHHSRIPLHLNFNLTSGCGSILISANENSMSVVGQIAAQCQQSGRLDLGQYGLDTEEDSHFCLYYEPLLDQLKLQVKRMNLTLCPPTNSLPPICCTALAHGSNTPNSEFGIMDGSIRGDIISPDMREAFEITDGIRVPCESLCHEGDCGSTQANVSTDNEPELPFTLRLEVKMEENFQGRTFTSTIREGESPDTATTVHLPSVLRKAVKSNNRVVCAFFKNSSIFQGSHHQATILEDVVEITVENEVIKDLSEPIKINFTHNVIPKTRSRTCVSWDTRKDPQKVTWLKDGCETVQHRDNQTECRCNHLTYFSILVQLEPKPVRHLLALTAITSLGCAVSVISCITLIVYLCRKRRAKEQSTHIHLRLAASLALLNLLFFLTGVLANVGGAQLCSVVGAALHYALLCSFTWMGIEVFHTFWLVYMVFSPIPKMLIWNLIGFALPIVPILILAFLGDVYGRREVMASENDTDPYLMCWMTTSPTAAMAHYFINLTVLAILVSAGLVMLLLVYREIRTRDEWRQRRVAFLSIWGLSCLFGTTWGLTFLDFGPLSEFILFLSCILISFQGFFLMLRFFLLDSMRKQAGGSALGSSSSGSTRQHMLQNQEKS
ncbi:adhesion G-protein coupled receptor G1 isoform 1-T4 [Synchiropus picturatus]